jgi:hypothetical protein
MKRRTDEESPLPLINRSHRKAWNLLSLVPPQIQGSRKMMIVSHGNQQQESLHLLRLKRQESKQGEGREGMILRRSSRMSPTLLSPIMAATKRTQLNGRSLFPPPSSYRAGPQDPLSRNLAMRQETMENPLVFASPMQVLEAKGKGASVDVPIEAVASVIESGANSIQRDNQGCPQGSSSDSPPSPSFNLPPTERAQVLHRSLAAELILAGTGTSPLIPPARHSQEPGTAISMIAPSVARRNNFNPSVQVPEDRRAEDELRHRDGLQRFGEACGAAVRETREAVEAIQVETARLRQAAGVVKQEQAASRQAMREGSSEARSQREASSSATSTRTTAAPVMDMLFCINNLDAIRSEAGDFSL